MCGIFGVVANERSGLSPNDIQKLTKSLFVLSESRGKEASGITVLNGSALSVLKQPMPASRLIRTPEFASLFAKLGNGSGPNGHVPHSIGIIGHSRLVTNGARETHENNQPAIADGIVAIHNGIIVNDEKLWNAHPDLVRTCQLDTEILLALTRKFLKGGSSVSQAFREAFATIEGSASVALMFEDFNCLLLGTNTGSLYFASDKKGTSHLFASERYILETLFKQHSDFQISPAGVSQIRPGQGCLVDLETLDIEHFPLTLTDRGHRELNLPITVAKRSIQDVSPVKRDLRSTSTVAPGAEIVRAIVDPEFERHVVKHTERVQQLKRCTRCVLPETMPFIEFDSAGICSYCRTYQPINPKGAEALAREVEPYRSKVTTEGPNCIISLSGGRDSSYGLHYATTVLGLKPVTYTYDWGMVTDLARRNISRLCGKLGVEHILVSADINKKRSNIRKNLSAWLKKPNLGMIPLLMAGDKQFFYHGERLRRQVGVDLVVLCDNLLEKTHFKTGFCGVSPTAKNSVYKIELGSRVKLASFYTREFLTNPSYLNSSLIDTVSAYASYYVLPHNMLSLFRYLPWDERSMTDTLRREYDWEIAKDTTTTWRIGDGTAAFYNYAYYAIAGFTENDTFRSNQIREGMITREQAVEFIQRENQPRWDTLQWYCDVVGVDWRSAVRAINSVNPLGPLGKDSR